MAQVFGASTISNALAYWFERLAYTTTISLSPGSTQGVFSVSAWNGNNGARQVVSMPYMASTQDPTVQYTLVYDQQTRYLFGDQFPPSLRPEATNGSDAYQALRLTATNTSATQATTNAQVIYGIDVWTAPVAYKVMRGFPLTLDEVQTIARQAGIQTNPVQERGTFPIPLPTIIERTYANRIRRIVQGMGLPSPVATTQGNAFDQITALSNGMIVLRSLAAEADEDYGVTITVDRDNNPAHLVVDAGHLSLDHPLDLFIPAMQSLTFHIQAAQQPPGPVPVRYEVWHVAMDAILNVRLGRLTNVGLPELQGLYGQANGSKLYYDILAGVR